MTIYGIFKCHAGSAYGAPLICFGAKTKWEALNMFYTRFSLKTTTEIRRKYTAVPV